MRPAFETLYLSTNIDNSRKYPVGRLCVCWICFISGDKRYEISAAVSAAKTKPDNAGVLAKVIPALSGSESKHSRRERGGIGRRTGMSPQRNLGGPCRFESCRSHHEYTGACRRMHVGAAYASLSKMGRR